MKCYASMLINGKKGDELGLHEWQLVFHSEERNCREKSKEKENESKGHHDALRRHLWAGN